MSTVNHGFPIRKDIKSDGQVVVTTPCDQEIKCWLGDISATFNVSGVGR
jgi:hypothetical protein